MNKYRVGIIGFGWVAGAHLEAFKKMDQFEPYAILSTRPLDPVEFKKQHGADVKIYNDRVFCGVLISGFLAHEMWGSRKVFLPIRSSLRTKTPEFSTITPVFC
ncbi:MAG: hypothetical protein ISR78_08280 [Spirochaetia bacterium]|nr:hypothetical protein [Spirochaetia bacterium]